MLDRKPNFKKNIFRGLIFGLIAGLITSLFEGVYLLSSDGYVPWACPFLLTGVNLLVWMFFGAIFGFLLGLTCAGSRHYAHREGLYLVLFLLAPFCICFGTAGMIRIEKPYLPSLFCIISFSLSGIILLFLILQRVRGRYPDKRCAVDFIPELAVITALFIICTNLPAWTVAYFPKAFARLILTFQNLIP